MQMCAHNRSSQLRRQLKEGFLFFDGGYGTILAEAGLEPGERPELWNFRREDFIRDLHLEYLKAGCNLLKTNTFGGDIFHYAPELRQDKAFHERLIFQGVRLAREAIRIFEKEYNGETPNHAGHFIALDAGPTGCLLKPAGNLDFEEAVKAYGKSFRAGAEAGADCILIETMMDSYETKAALLAAKENTDLPVFVTNTYQANGTLLTGASIRGMIAMLEGLGADAIGMNCGLGPEQMLPFMDIFAEYASVPVIVNPNAGLPLEQNGQTVYPVRLPEFISAMEEMARKGARLLGGCCGTTPEYIRCLTKAFRGKSPVPLIKKHHTLITSGTQVVEFGKKPVLIGERINPTGKKKLQQALLEGDMSYLARQALDQQEHFAQVLDVNTGMPGINEPEVLARTVETLQTAVSVPLQIDTADPAALEKAMRIYNGKPMVNSVNGKKESMEAVFPLVKKYGGLVVGLTLDEKGIPAKADQRVKIAKRICDTGAQYGIDPKDIIIDPLAMAVSADPRAATETLSCIRQIKEHLHLPVSLGISNVSFGLPSRETLNAVFFASALEQGLDAAIINPHSSRMLETYFGYCALHQMDEQFLTYIDAVSRLDNTSRINKAKVSELETTLEYYIKKGLADQAVQKIRTLLAHKTPMEIIDSQLIPALDEAGKDFEENRIYLPQLIMCSQAARQAFDVLKEAAAREPNGSRKKGAIVLATVKGDVHDIGKNIVKVLLENYGYDVIDLGIDVSPEKIVSTVKEKRIRLAGLSALMTTTVPSMEKTVALLRLEAPKCRIVVGGAVLNQNYADKMGADCYAPTAMDTVRFAEQIFS